MTVLVDTNVLILIIQPDHPSQKEALAALRFLLTRNGQAFVFLQNMAEFWNVCTRTLDKNGLGLSVEETGEHMASLDEIVTLLPDTTTLYYEWRCLVLQHRVKGVQVHDARLAAGMISHGSKAY